MHNAPNLCIFNAIMHDIILGYINLVVYSVSCEGILPNVESFKYAHDISKIMIIQKAIIIIESLYPTFFRNNTIPELR